MLLPSCELVIQPRPDKRTDEPIEKRPGHAVDCSGKSWTVALVDRRNERDPLSTKPEGGVE